MSDPDLASSMTKPDVMAAIADCTKNPMNIFKYQNNPEVSFWLRHESVVTHLDSHPVAQLAADVVSCRGSQPVV